MYWQEGGEKMTTQDYRMFPDADGTSPIVKQSQEEFEEMLESLVCVHVPFR